MSICDRCIRKSICCDEELYCADFLKERLHDETEYKAKIKELEDAISRCEQVEKEFKSRTCKFRSPTNCDFCSFHSDCEEHWKEGEADDDT